MRQALQRAWLQRGLLAWLLLPLSLVYAVAIRVRALAYERSWLRAESAGVPVIIVGNVVAGGTGKTPIVHEVVRHLADRGIRAGIVSRGYGRRTADCREVRADSDARDVGDEPLLLALSCGVPVFVASQRIEAARALLAAYPQTQVIVSDDGLQHRSMARDMEICVFDERGVGNGWLLPAGPLREMWPRKVDFVLGPGGFRVARALAPDAHTSDGRRIPVTQLPEGITAVAGIAKPQAFFDLLAKAGVKVGRAIALDDHADFAAVNLPREVVCTEKDAVKLWRTHPGAWAVPLVVDIEPAFWRAFDDLADAKLSSKRGSQTA